MTDILNKNDDASINLKRKIKQYEMLREGHHHEWTILSTRITAYLSSQALFASGVAVLYVNSSEQKQFYLPILFLSAIAIILAFLSSVSISINICVLNDWHALITNFLARDRNSDDLLEGYYLPRHQPDMLHRISVVYYCRLITLIVGGAWIIAIASVLNHFVDFINPIATILFTLLVVTWWIMFLTQIESKWGPLNRNLNDKTKQIAKY